MPYKINILTDFPSNEFTRQEPSGVYPNFKFSENGDLSENYDMILVYEGLNKEIKVNCNRKNLIFISGEPPHSRVYVNGFINQFEYIITSHSELKHRNHIHSQQSLPWHFGLNFQTRNYNFDYESLLKLDCPLKRKKMSIIVSNKTMMPGHKQRIIFVEKLKKYFKNDIDFFGKGINPIEDKADAILSYFSTICIENSSIPNYWSEKLADSYLGYALPIYYGCTNLNNYFSEESYINIDLNRIDESIEKIEWCLKNIESLYNDRLNEIIASRNSVLNKYNIYSLIVDFFLKNQLSNNQLNESILLKPNHSFLEYEFKTSILRTKRLFQGWLIKQMI